MPHALSEQAVHLVKYDDMARWVWDAGEGLDRIVRQVYTGLLGELREELCVRNRPHSVVLRFCTLPHSFSQGFVFKMRVHVCGTRRTRPPIGAEETSHKSISLLPQPFVVHALVSHLPSYEGDFALLLDVQKK